MAGGEMWAAVLTGPGKVETRRVAIPQAGAGEVRIRLEGCGVCSSNLPPFEGRPWFNYPMPPGQPGHEGWGVVDQVGQGVAGLREGDRVAALSERAYAQWDVVPADRVVPLPRPLEGLPVPLEPLGCAVNVFARSSVRPGCNVAVVGVGFMGAMLVGLAVRAGARVIAISRRPCALRAASAMGAHETIPMDDHWKIIEAVKNLTSGRMCHVVIEAVGQQWPLDLAGELTAERARLVIAGYHQDAPRQVNMQMWNWRGLDVVNAHERDWRVYLQAMRSAAAALVRGELNPWPLLTHRYPLSGLASAFTDALSRPEGFIKGVIEIGQDTA